jgi:hypothetical protein
MADPNPNRVRAANDALWALVEATIPDAVRHRNPSGHKQPAAKTDGLAGYVAQQDDEQPEIVGVMCGPVYDLKAVTELTFAFSGKTKDARKLAAHAYLELLKAALEADRLLGGVVSYADIAGAQTVDVADSDWMAGGLYVQVGMLFDAPTPAG